MKLFVRLIEARNIPITGPNAITEPYVKLKLGRQKFRSTVMKRCSNPIWCEEFTFKVEDLKEELRISVLDEDKYFNHDYVGEIKIPVLRVFEDKDQSLGTAWYTLHPIDKRAKCKDCGEVLLTICFSQSSSVDLSPVDGSGKMLKKSGSSIPRSSSFQSSFSSPARSEEATPPKEEKYPSTLAGRIANIFNKNTESASLRHIEASDVLVEQESVDSVDLEPKIDEQATSVDFEELMKTMEMREQGSEVPDSLSGGVVLDQLYAVPTQELNSIIFSPNSSFWKSLAEAVGSTNLQAGPWKFDGTCLKRVISYTKPPTKIVKSLKAIEDHTVLKADGKNFVVLATVETPDAPYGKTFKVEVLYSITPGPEQPSGGPSSRIVVSWRINFLQSTMMKGMIESGVRQGIKVYFEQFEKILSQFVKPLELNDFGSEKDKLLASLQVEHQSDWKLAVQYLTNITVISTAFLGLYVIVHLSMAIPRTSHGLEFVTLDLPDSISELLVSAALVLIGKRALDSISRFMHARVHKGGDHGIKAQGAGWLLTVALIEGRNLTTADSIGFLDTYVVFTCNGKKRTSSTKFQKSDPLWNEIFEFDAMDGPPSVLHVEVFGFDGPFAIAKSLGQAEVNFLKSNISDLSDIWIPLITEEDQDCQAKLHLRIFLNTTKGKDYVKEYLAKMEKEVGKKIKLRSSQTHRGFQKLFGLPPEEFLIDDFVCSLKRKMPHQGRLFLSARVVGFHSDLFGHKIKFFFMWEDIDDIQVIPSRLGSSTIVIMILKPGRGFDARHGARTQDIEGRLKFHLQSFVSSALALKTIMALWRARNLTPEKKAQISEEEPVVNGNSQTPEDSPLPENLPLTVVGPDAKSQFIADEELDSRSIQIEESMSIQEVELADMSVIYSSMLSLPMSFIMELFEGTLIEKWVMERAGCLDYSPSLWEPEKADVDQRQIHYWFDKLGSNQKVEANSTQQKFPLGKNGWIIEETITPCGEYFVIHLKYLIESLPSKSVGCSIQVYFGISWTKSNSKQKKKTAKNVISNLQTRFKVISSAMEKDYVSR